MDKKQFQLEFPIKCSPNILFGLIATASGLQEWFADKVDRHAESFFFTWEGNTDEAIRLGQEENVFVRYKWEYMDEGEYFEFRISQSPITNETILIISDFAADYELKDQQQLWESQIEDLKTRIGS